jgi:hypothetical protein
LLGFRAGHITIRQKIDATLFSACCSKSSKPPETPDMAHFTDFTVQDSVLLGKDFAVAINYGRFSANASNNLLKRMGS